MGLTRPIYCGLDSAQPCGLGWCSSPPTKRLVIVLANNKVVTVPSTVTTELFSFFATERDSRSACKEWKKTAEYKWKATGEDEYLERWRRWRQRRRQRRCSSRRLSSFLPSSVSVHRHLGSVFFRRSLSLFCYSSSSAFFFSFLPLFYKPSLMLFSAFSSPFRSLSKSLVLSLPHGFLSIICQPPPLFSSFFFFPLLPLSSYCSSSIYSPWACVFFSHRGVMQRLVGRGCPGVPPSVSAVR